MNAATVYDHQIEAEEEKKARDEFLWHEANTYVPTDWDAPEVSSFDEWTDHMDDWYEEQRGLMPAWAGDDVNW